MFLLRFRSAALRNMALLAQAVQNGNCMLNIMPWSRRFRASVGKLKFCIRVCLEGVPRHARNAVSVAQLFNNPSFIDKVDCSVEKEAERFCFNVWVWTDAPNDLAVEGTLLLEEPIEHPDEYLCSMCDFEPLLLDLHRHRLLITRFLFIWIEFLTTRPLRPAMSNIALRVTLVEFLLMILLCRSILRVSSTLGTWG